MGGNRSLNQGHNLNIFLRRVRFCPTKMKSITSELARVFTMKFSFFSNTSWSNGLGPVSCPEKHIVLQIVCWYYRTLPQHKKAATFSLGLFK